jgi:hypothetical protein
VVWWQRRDLWVARWYWSRPPFAVVILSQLSLCAIVSFSLWYPCSLWGIENFWSNPFPSVYMNLKRNCIVIGRGAQIPGARYSGRLIFFFYGGAWYLLELDVGLASCHPSGAQIFFFWKICAHLVILGQMDVSCNRVTGIVFYGTPEFCWKDFKL